MWGLPKLPVVAARENALLCFTVARAQMMKLVRPYFVMQRHAQISGGMRRFCLEVWGDDT